MTAPVRVDALPGERVGSNPPAAATVKRSGGAEEAGKETVLKSMLARRTLFLTALTLAPMCWAQEGEKRGTFVIEGNVNRPGKFDLVEPLHIFDALNRAGGFKEGADRRRILILRGDQEIIFDRDAYVRGKNTKGNILVEDGDVVVVH
jgi:protein involved in polysaccharide export with SLBB domain